MIEAAALVGVVMIAALSWLAVGRLQRSLTARAIVDTPNERTLHSGAIPRGGGLVIAVMLVAVSFLLAWFTPFTQTFIALGVLVSCWAGLGWGDDTKDLSPLLRFLVQLSLAAVTIFLFGYVSVVYVTDNLYVSLGWFGAVVTVCGVIWLSNLYNFMDGMDGLAASQTIVAALTLAVWSLQLGDYGLVAVLLVLAAASYGFLLHNWHPASIFMGDVGSTTIGAFFGTVIVILNVRHGVPVLALVMVFAVFVLDATVTLFRRVVRGEQFWLPHRSHYYQRLAALGFNHSKIVLIYIVLMLFCAMLATFAATGHARIPLTCLCVVGLLGAGMALVTRLEASRG